MERRGESLRGLSQREGLEMDMISPEDALHPAVTGLWTVMDGACGYGMWVTRALGMADWVGCGCAATLRDQSTCVNAAECLVHVGVILSP